MAEAVRISFLGGLGEIGRNCAVVEQEGRLVVLDCGVMFPNAEMPGVDLVLPDFTFLRERAKDVDGIVLTHGHEDHVGALAYLLRDVDARDLWLGADPRVRPQPARRGRPRPEGGTRTRPRRRATQDRPLRRGVHPGHPLGAERLRDRIPHRAGSRAAQRGLQAGPEPCRQATDGPLPDRADRSTPKASASSCPTRRMQSCPATPAASAAWASRCAGSSSPSGAVGSWWPASPVMCTASSSSPTLPSRAAARWRCSAARCRRTSVSPSSSAL